MLVVTISMLVVMHLWILYNTLPGYVWYFVIYIYCTRVILPLFHHYIWFFINMFVHSIPVYAFIPIFIFYNILIGFTTSWEFFAISILWMGYSNTTFLCVVLLCLCILYECVHQYFFLLNLIYSLVVIQLGNLVVYI